MAGAMNKAEIEKLATNMIYRRVRYDGTIWKKFTQLLPKEVRIIEECLTKRAFVVSGGVVPFLLGYTNTFGDVDVFICESWKKSNKENQYFNRPPEEEKYPAEFKILTDRRRRHRLQLIYVGDLAPVDKSKFTRLANYVLRHDHYLVQACFTMQGYVCDWSSFRLMDPWIKENRAKKYKDRQISHPPLMSLADLSTLKLLKDAGNLVSITDQWTFYSFKSMLYFNDIIETYS